MVVFGVKFDLQKGVEEALKDGDKALERIEKALGKHPITIKLRMDNKVARGTSAELTGFRKQLAELTQQWNSLTAAERGSAAGAAIREKFRALRTEAQGYTSTLQAAVKAEDKMRESHSKTAASANKLSSAYHNQSTYLSRLIQRMAAYAGVSYVGNFLTNVREVTAQFELQRISLGAIIQDQQRANQLFEEIKTFALKSPVKILDLTKYTKQLAAYKIGVDELFDTTKRLTDISQGLGVSMDRIVLMYGQIRATGYLRASEVRQATEAGIPLVEELANKLSKANGELVRASDVMEMISKREIPFEMVKEVFEDMTSAGGIFYNMQEKQGNTLFGMWQKLGDAAAVMYDQIGNTSSVNEGMKMAIQTLRYLMLHWKQVGIVVGGVSVYILANTIATKNNAIATAAATTANKLHIASLQQKLGALRLEQMNLKSTAIFQRLHTAATISATKAQIGAATSTNVFSKALYGLKAALLSNPLTALAVALTTIIALLMQSESELDKLNSKLQDIDRDYDASGKKSVDRFKELVKAVEENVDGSKAQKEALDELDRTYSKILGSEALELDSLKALGGQYGELIDMIEAYNAKKKGEERETAIKSSYATILDEEKDDLMDYLNQAGMSAEKQAAFIQAINDKMLEGKDAVTATNEAFNEFADDISQLASTGNVINVLNFDKLADAWGVGFRQLGGLFGGQGMDYLYNYARALEGQNKALEDNEKQTRLAADAMGVYSTSVDGLNKSFANLDWSSMEALYNSLQDYNSKHPENMISVPIDLSFDPEKAETEYDKLLEISNMKINAIFSVLQQIATQEGQTIPEEFYKQAKSVVEGNKDFSFIDWAKLEEQFKNSPKALAAIRASKQLYESIAPSDDTIRMFNRKFMTLADNMDVSLDKMQKYLMKSGDNLGEHRKKLSDEVTNLLKQIARLEWTKKMLSMFGLPADAVEEKIQESQQTLKLLQSMIADIPDIEAIGQKKKGGRQSDPRLQTLQEIANKMAEVNKEYDELLKKEGQTKALADTQKLFASSFKQMEATAKKYKFKLPAFEVPQTIEDVQKWYKAIMDNIKRLNLKNADKVLIELGFKSDKAAIDKQQKDIEAELKALADRISRTKTAKEFYEKILGMTGDVELAANLTVSVYGQNGQDLQDAIREQIRTAFETDPEKNVTIDLSEAIDPDTGAINYNRLADLEEKYKDVLIKERADLRKKLIEEGRKISAAQVQQWLKDIEKAKDFAQQRIDLATYTANQIAAINARTDLPQADRDRLIKGYQNREAEQLAKLQYEEFKDSAMYVHIFEDLDHASTTALRNMRDRLVALKGQWKNLDPTQVKELTKAIADLDEQIAGRSPFKSILDGFKGLAAARPQKVIDAEMIAATDELAKREEALAAATKKLTEAQTAQDNAQAEVAQARQNLEDALAVSGGEETAEVKAAREILGIKIATFNAVKAASADSIAAAKKDVDLAADRYEQQKKIIDDLVAEGKLREANIKKIELANQKIDEYQQQINEALDGIRKMMEAFGASDEDMQFFDDVVGSLNEIVDAGQQAAMSVASFMSGNILGGITSGISAIGGLVSGFTNLFSAGKVRKANKEIKRQQELLEQLEYTYGRLEKAADKLFGRDYVNNYNQQLKNLQAQQTAYLKQAEAERSKGKKADKERIKEYEEAARETADKIKELQDDLVAHFTGSTKTDVARQMAQSWIDARASMSDTFAAIKGDYQEMIKNMIVEGAAARVIENALTPVWDSMEKMLEKNDVQGAIDSLVNGMDSALNAANNGMEVLWKALEARGYDMKKLIGDTDSEYTGIAKSVAGATSEEINNVAAIGNTLMYYVSPIPRIDENLARVVAIMEGRAAALPTASGVTTGAIDYTEMFTTANQHLSSLPRMEQHLAEIHTMLGRALKTKGATSGFNVFLNA